MLGQQKSLLGPGMEKKMETQGAERGGTELVRFLNEKKFKHVFGLPGSSMVAPLYELQRTDIEFVPAIHESVAVAAADGYARVAGSAVVMLYMLPGLANGLANIYNAGRDETPLIVIASQQASKFRSENATIGEGDLVNLMHPHCRMSHELAPGMSVRFWLERAHRVATGPLPGPAFLSIPEDVFEGLGPVGAPVISTSPVGSSPDPRDVAIVLQQAERPLILVGGQLRRFGGSEVIEGLAERHGFALAFESGFPDRYGVAPGHMNCFGGISGAPDLEASADAVVAVGARFLLEAHPRPAWFPAARFTAQINADPLKLEETRQVHWAAAADPAAFARSLAVALENLPRDESLVGRRRAWLTSLREAGAKRSVSSLMQTYYSAVMPLFDALDRGWVVDESVMGVVPLGKTLSALDGRRYVGTSGASLGWATGAAVGVALASGEPVTCVLGDGALRFGALGLWTIRAQNLPVTLVVIDNGGYGSTRFFERQYVQRLGAEASPQSAGYLGSDLRGTGSSVEGVIAGFGIPVERVPIGGNARSAIERAWDRSAHGPNAVVIEMEFAE